MPNQIAFYPQSSGGGGLPVATAAGQVPTSTGAGTTYTAQTPSSGMALISNQVLASPAATVTFSSIPQTFTNLKLVIQASASTTAGFNALLLQFNGDTAAHYQWQELFGAAGSPGASTSGGLVTSVQLGNLSDTTSSIIGGATEITVPNYAGTVFNKSLLSFTQGDQTAVMSVGGWSSTAALTQIQFLLGSAGNFVTGSTFSLYGMA